MMEHSSQNLPGIKQQVLDYYGESVFTEGLIEVIMGVGSIFSDPIRTRAWLLTPNLDFGEYSPLELILIGRGDKVLQFVRNRLEGELP
jgi:hypothetical protein